MTDAEREDIRAIFAGLAMNGLLSGQTMRHASTIIEHDFGNHSENITVAQSIASDAVVFADALLLALKGK